MPKTNCKEGDVVGECCIDLRAALIAPFLFLFVLAFLINLFYGNEQF